MRIKSFSITEELDKEIESYASNHECSHGSTIRLALKRFFS